MKKKKLFGITLALALYTMSATAFAQVQFSSNESSFETFE